MAQCGHVPHHYYRAQVKLRMAAQKSWLRHWKQQVNLGYYITTSFVIIRRLAKWNQWAAVVRICSSYWSVTTWLHLFAGNLLKDDYGEDYNEWGDNITTVSSGVLNCGLLAWVLWAYLSSCNKMFESIQNLGQLQPFSLGQTCISKEEWTINLPKYYILNYTRMPTYNHIPDTGV